MHSKRTRCSMKVICTVIFIKVYHSASARTDITEEAHHNVGKFPPMKHRPTSNDLSPPYTLVKPKFPPISIPDDANTLSPSAFTAATIAPTPSGCDEEPLPDGGDMNQDLPAPSHTPTEDDTEADNSNCPPVSYVTICPSSDVITSGPSVPTSDKDISPHASPSPTVTADTTPQEDASTEAPSCLSVQSTLPSPASEPWMPSAPNAENPTISAIPSIVPSAWSVHPNLIPTTDSDYPVASSPYPSCMPSSNPLTYAPAGEPIVSPVLYMSPTSLIPKEPPSQPSGSPSKELPPSAAPDDSTRPSIALFPNFSGSPTLDSEAPSLALTSSPTVVSTGIWPPGTIPPSSYQPSSYPSQRPTSTSSVPFLLGTDSPTASPGGSPSDPLSPVFSISPAASTAIPTCFTCPPSMVEDPITTPTVATGGPTVFSSGTGSPQAIPPNDSSGSIRPSLAVFPNFSGIPTSIATTTNPPNGPTPRPSPRGSGGGFNDPTSDLSNCNVLHKQWVGDGWCDSTNGLGMDQGYNSAACLYDGGDCCPETCVSSTLHTCGRVGYHCIDPNV